MKPTLIIAAIVLLVAVPSLFWWLYHRSAPTLDGTETLTRLTNPVSVKFDQHAVPYIEARSEEDAFMAQGYVTARERMYQMDILRRSANGELSEIFGISALEGDRLMRTIGIRKLAEAEIEHLAPAARASLDAYTQGVNAYLSTYYNNLPLEFGLIGYTPHPWRSEDSLAILKYQAYLVDESWRLDDLRQRVSNKVGVPAAAEFFRDDLIAYALPPLPKATAEGAESNQEHQHTVNPVAEKSVAPEGGKTANPPGQIQTPTNKVRKPPAMPQTRTESRLDNTNAADTQTPINNGGSRSTNIDSSSPLLQPADMATPEVVAPPRRQRIPRPTLPAQPLSPDGAGPAGRDNDLPAPAPASGPQTMLNRPPVELLLKQLSQWSKLAHAFNDPSPTLGSTAWVVPPATTRTHGALLACDKHGPMTMPCQWYICSLNAPGLHVCGATMPGVPGVIVGRNENIAWGSAATKADVQDIFLEQFQTQFDPAYNTPSGWQNAETSTEAIPVRFGKDVEHKIFKTRHGPVLMRSNDAGVSLSWTGLNTIMPSYAGLLQMNKAGNWQDFSKAAELYSDPPMTFIYADRWGNVGYKLAGQIPIRNADGAGTMLTPGWLEKGTWKSMVAADKLPQTVLMPTTAAVKNMPIVAANQRPARGGSLYPMADPVLNLGHQWAPPYRANRVLSAITSAQEPLTIADMNQLQGDEYSQLAPLLSRTLQVAATQTHLIDRDGIASINALVRWDGQLTPKAPAASIYSSYMQTLSRRILEPTLGRQLATEYMQRWPLWLTLNERVLRDKPANLLANDERSYNGFLLTTLAQATKSLQVRFSSNTVADWIWGQIHQVEFQSVGNNAGNWLTSYFNAGPYPIGGSAECLNSCDVDIDPAALQYGARTGPTQRMIIDMSDRDKFYQNLSTGQSGHKSSPYSTDQLPAWMKVDPAPIAFSDDQVMRQTKHQLKLENQYTH